MKPAAVIELYMQEALEIHALADRAKVPRLTDDGSVFSLSQRVAVMAGVIEALVVKAGMQPTTLQ